MLFPAPVPGLPRHPAYSFVLDAPADTPRTHNKSRAPSAQPALASGRGRQKRRRTVAARCITAALDNARRGRGIDAQPESDATVDKPQVLYKRRPLHKVRDFGQQLHSRQPEHKTTWPCAVECRCRARTLAGRAMRPTAYKAGGDK